MLVPPRGHSVRPSISTPCAAACFPMHQDLPHRWQRRGGGARRHHARESCPGACGLFRRGAALEHKQHAFRARIVGGEPPVPEHRLEPHDILVKAPGALHVIGIDCGFENPLSRDTASSTRRRRDNEKPRDSGPAASVA